MYIWNQAPLFKMLLPFIAGILIAIYFPQPIEGGSLLLLTLFLFLASMLPFKVLHGNYKIRWIYGFLAYSILFLSGHQLAHVNTERFSKDHILHSYSNVDYMQVRVIDYPKEKKSSVKVLVEVERAFVNQEWTSARGKLMCYFEKSDEALHLLNGDKLLLEVRLKAVDGPQNPGEFDYRQYLAFHQIHLSTYIPKGNWERLNDTPDYSLFSWVQQIRSALLGVFQSNGLKDKELAVASALILGQKDSLGDDLVQAYASAGAMHVLAVSGLHVGIIFLVLNFFYGSVERMPHGNKFKALLLLLSIWAYAILTGLSPSVMRASTMFSFIIIGNAMQRNTNIYNTLGASALLLLALNPFLIMEVGFQLSYLAVLGIVYLQPKVYGAIEIKNKWLDKVWAITAVSIAAQISTFPVGLLYFHQFPNYFLLSNLLVIPAATVILYLGLLILAVSPISILAKLLTACLYHLIYALNYCIYWIESLPYALMQGISISVFETWFIYALMLIGVGFVELRRSVFLRWALAGSIVLIGFQGWEAYSEGQQHQLIVYNVKGNTAIDIIDGKQNIFLSEEKLVGDEGKMLFHIRHNWWDKGIQETRYEMINSSQDSLFMHHKGFFSLANKTIMVANGSFCQNKFTEPFPADYLIVSGNPKCSLKEIIKAFPSKEIIIDASNSYYNSNRWKREAHQLNKAIYIVREKGAYVADLNT